MNDKEINKLIQNMMSKKTLLALSMQPKKHTISLNGQTIENAALINGEIHGLAISDNNIYDEWRKTEWLFSLDNPQDDPLDQFSQQLSELLHMGNRTQDFNITMAKVIKGSFETGQFVEAKDKSPLIVFLKENPDIANFLANNINTLNDANKQIENYISKPKKMIEELSPLEEQIANAKKAIVNKLKENSKLLNINENYFSNGLKILPKSLIPFRVEKLQRNKNSAGFDPEKKMVLDELESLENNLKKLTSEYLAQKKQPLGERVQRKTKEEYKNEAEVRRSTAHLITTTKRRSQYKHYKEARKQDLEFRAKFARELLQKDNNDNNSDKAFFFYNASNIPIKESFKKTLTALGMASGSGNFRIDEVKFVYDAETDNLIAKLPGGYTLTFEQDNNTMVLSAKEKNHAKSPQKLLQALNQVKKLLLIVKKTVPVTPTANKVQIKTNTETENWILSQMANPKQKGILDTPGAQELLQKAKARAESNILNKLSKLKEKVSETIEKVAKIHKLNSNYLTRQDGNFIMGAEARKKFETKHPNAAKEILALIKFDNALNMALLSRSTAVKSPIKQAITAVENLIKDTENLPATSWIRRFSEAIQRFFGKLLVTTRSESYMQAEKIENEIKKTAVEMQELDKVQVILNSYEHSKTKTLNEKSKKDDRSEPSVKPKFK